MVSVWNKNSDLGEKRGIAHQSAHCGKTDLKVSVQEHLITLMNSPGLRMTFLHV